MAQVHGKLHLFLLFIIPCLLPDAEGQTSSLKILPACWIVVPFFLFFTKSNSLTSITSNGTYHAPRPDYFAEDFDKNKNCINKEELKRQLNKNRGKYCCTFQPDIEIANAESYILEKCQLGLTNKVKDICGSKEVENTGTLSYCLKMGEATCCFRNHKCKSHVKKLEDMSVTAMKYLKNKQSYLQEHLVREVGYKSCHHIKDYDATVCAKDCETFSNNDFAKNCSGVFKCCIRRDSFCDQCRFCCTLPMCTFKQQGHQDTITVFDSNPNTTLEKGMNAKEIYSADHFMYKSNDYRCLNPKSNKKPKEWKHYNMSKFRDATTEQELSKVPNYKFDKNFFNFFDKDVLKKYTSSNGTKLMEKTYGFDYCAKVPVRGHYAKCSKHCLKAEQSHFAKKCNKKKNHLFKCCVIGFSLAKIEMMNNNILKMMGLKTEPELCIKPGGFAKCTFCCATYTCTKREVKDNQVFTHDTFKTKTTSAQKVGGTVGLGLKYSVCLNQDYCTEQRNWTLYDMKMYQKATDLKHMCQLRSELLTNSIHLKVTKHSKKVKLKKCLRKKKSNVNVHICSSKKLKNASKKLKKTNRILKKYRKMLKKREHEHKKKSKRKKEKKSKNTKIDYGLDGDNDRTVEHTNKKVGHTNGTVGDTDATVENTNGTVGDTDGRVEHTDGTVGVNDGPFGYINGKVGDN